MRITVGHVLILAGLGGAAWWHFSSQGFDKPNLLDKYSSVTSSVGSLMDLFKSGAQPTPAIINELKPMVPIETPKSEPPPVVPVPDEVKPEIIKEPVVAPSLKKDVATPKRLKKKKARIQRDPLLGSLVTLTLNSGREVKGILEERTATAYKIQLPGMGPFTYEASKVTAIKPAK